MKNINILIVILLSLSTSSCAIIGLNVHRRTPSKPGKYPEFTEADTLRGKLNKYRTAYDISFYDINIDLDIDEKYIQGYVDMYFETVEDFDTIQIDLYENMKINAVIFDSDSLTFQRKHRSAFITFKNTILKNKQGILRVYYEGSPIKAARPPWEGGFVWKKDNNKNPWIGVSCELDGASLWWPLKDHLYDEPDSMRLSVIIPEGLFCVSNGKLVEQEKVGTKERFTWKTNYPINSYNITLYIGDYTHFSVPYSGIKDSFDLDFYVLKYNLDKAKEHFKQSEDILHFFEKKFAPYPWSDEGYKLVESPYAGMEHQTAIAYGQEYKNKYGYNFDYIILHETAHEWWGNSLSAMDYAEIWLHEGFATYSEALYVEHKDGYDAYIDFLRFYSVLIKNKRPLIGPFDVNYWDYKDGDVYMKGALLLHTLRNLIDNDELFFDILQSFYNKYAYSIATTQNFIDLVHEKTNEKYDWFFQQYLYSRVCPQLEWNYAFNGNLNRFEVRYKWNNVGEGFKLPVVLNTNTGKKILYPSTKLKVLTLPNGEPITMNPNNSYISLLKNKKL